MLEWLRLHGPKPLNVLAGLTGGNKGSIEIAYKGEGENSQLVVTQLNAINGKKALKSTFDEMLELGYPTLDIRIVPRSARGKHFTTGSRKIDRVSGESVTAIQARGTFRSDMMRIVEANNQVWLVLNYTSVEVRGSYNGIPYANLVHLNRLIITSECSVLCED